VRISRQDYWLPTPFASFPFTSPPVRHRVPSHSDTALTRMRPAAATERKDVSKLLCSYTVQRTCVFGSLCPYHHTIIQIFEQNAWHFRQNLTQPELSQHIRKKVPETF